MRKLSIVLCSIFSASFIFGCGEVEPLYIDDQITNTVDTLQVVFEIGEEFGDSTNTFWSIVAADIDDQGRIFVLDEVDASVKAYDLQGNFIRQVTRRGSGPGELLRPRGIAAMNNGNLVISAPSKKGYIVFDESLEFLEEVSIWQNNSPYHISPLTSDKLVMCRYDENQHTDVMRHMVTICDWKDQSIENVLWKDSIEISNSEWDRDPSVPLNFTMFHLLSSYGDGNGRVYFGVVDSIDYRVIGWDSTGSEILNISRNINPVKKSDEEIIAESVYMNSVLRRFGDSPWELRPNPYRNMIADVGIGPDENLWVRRGTRTDIFFDIYNLNGVLLRHAIYPVDRWSWKTEITPYGILAWELDPLEGYQKLYFIH